VGVDEGGDVRAGAGLGAVTLVAALLWMLAGGATAAVALQPDTAVRLEVERLGSTGFSVTD